MEGLSVNCGSCWPHVKIDFYEGGVVGGINTSKAKSPSNVQRTRCPAFSYADTTKGRPVLKPPTQILEH